MLIFVCTGNTCRSAIAEVMARDIFIKRNIQMSVSSRGISAGEGWVSTDEAKQSVKKYSLSLDTHRSKPVTQTDIDAASLILTMTYAHKSAIIRKFKNAEQKTYTIYEYATGCSKDVEDPYYCGLDVYNQCAEEIYKLIEIIAEKYTR